MTNEQRAAQITGWIAESFSGKPIRVAELEQRIIMLFQEAIISEREACAKIAETALNSELISNKWQAGKTIAEAIRTQD